MRPILYPVLTVATIALLGVAISPPAAVAESPCAHPKSKQFDFWIGEWDVTAGGNPAGKSKIVPLLGGCVLQEHWSGAQGGAGTSLNYFNPETGKWHQHWVWQKGASIDLEGELREGRMVLEGEKVGADGKKSRSRITWTANADGSVRQLWESSVDGGITWTAVFDGLYRRRPAPSAGT